MSIYVFLSVVLLSGDCVPISVGMFYGVVGVKFSSVILYTIM